MSRTRQVLISAVVMAALSALVAGTVAAKPSGAGPGNSPNAKVCQKGGWENLADGDGNGFANQDECVAYAAKGGVPQPKPSGEADLTLSPGAFDGEAYTYYWGTSSMQTFTVENVGTGESDTLAVLGGVGGGQFSATNDSCTDQALAPNETCTFDISYVDKGHCDSEPFGVLSADWALPPGTPATHYISLTVWPSCPT